jgi:copper resistance protein C
MRRTLRVLLPAATLLAAVPLLAARHDAASHDAPALPHLKLKASFPAKDSTLTSSPDAVRLWLTEPADLPATRISVADAKGAAVPLAKLTRGTKASDPVEGRFAAPLTSGRYTVTWKAMSKDGHVVNGTFAFTVRLGGS